MSENPNQMQIEVRKMIFRKLLGVCCAAALVFTGQTPVISKPSVTASAASGPVSYYGELQANGNQIYGANVASPVQVKGMSFFWSNWGGQYWNSGTVSRMVDEFKCEILRCSIGVDDYGSLYSGGDVNMLRSVVDAAIAQDVYVIIDWHSHGAHNNPDAAKNFFSEMARDYGKYDNVIFEVYNEPTQVAWETVKSYAEGVISTIRQYSDNLILVGTPTWSQDVDSAAYNPISDSNVAYVLHFYAGTHGSQLRGKADTARNQGVPVFISEWGTVNADGDGSVNYSSTEEWLSWADSNQISWCNWAINNKAEGSSIFGGDGSSLTEAGNYLKKLLNTHAETAQWRNPPVTTTTTTSTTTTTTTITSGSDSQSTTTTTTTLPPQTNDTLHTLQAGSDNIIQGEAYAQMSGIELEECVNGGQNVGYIEVGDWLTYRILASDQTNYEMIVTYAAETQTGRMKVYLDNQEVSGAFEMPATGGWQSWNTASGVSFTMDAGEHTLKLVAESDGFNIDSFNLKAEAVSSQPQDLAVTMRGDVNCDQIVDISDVILLSRIAAEDKTAPATLQGRVNAECDGNTGITSQDAVMVLRFVARLIQNFPI